MTHAIPPRRVSSSKTSRRVSPAVSLIALASFALAQAPAKRFPVTSDMIVAAMQYRQLPVEGVQVRIAAPITSAVANPMLDVQSISVIDARSAQLRLVCRNHAECLPFYVSATWPPHAESQNRSAAQSTLSTSQQNRAPFHLTSVNFESTGRRASSQIADTPVQPTLRPGTPATLLIEDDRVHIRLSVICLEPGGPGDKVRVSTPDHKQHFVAEIITPQLLKGSFPR